MNANPKAKSKRGKKRGYEGDDMSRKEGDVYILNRRGTEICRNYNRGSCGSRAAQGKCPQARSHQCNKCLGPHQAIECKR